MADTPKYVLIRCDAAPVIGFGHVVRCLALANQLRDKYGCLVEFAMVQGPKGCKQVQAEGYSVYTPVDGSNGLDEGDWLQDLVINHQYQVLVLDVRTDLSITAVQSIRDSGVIIVTIDDLSDRRLAADLAFYPPVPQVERLDWTGYAGECLVGWDWVLLRPQFAEVVHNTQANKEIVVAKTQVEDQPLSILVTMGGSDPAGFTLMALEALEQIDTNLCVLVVIGGGFVHETAFYERLDTTKRHYEVRRNVTDMASLMAKADLAVASFGVTAYELAAMGVPAIYLCLTHDHVESCEAFVAAEIAISLGEYSTVRSVDVAEAVQSLLKNPQQRRAMSEGGKKLLKRKGLAFVASKIFNFGTLAPCTSNVQTG